MRNLTWILVLSLMTLVACNKPNNNSVAAPPAPTNQCVLPNNQYGTGYNTGYNTYNPYNTGTNPYYNNGLTVANGTCDPQAYNQYYNAGFAPYPYTNFNTYNWGTGYAHMPLCDCPVNYRPVYHGSMGLGCVAIQYFQPIAIGASYWSLTPNNYQWVNWTQVSNTASNVGNYTNCYQQVAQACFTDIPSSCGSGFTCQSTAGGSRLGICRQQ